MAADAATDAATIARVFTEVLDDENLIECILICLGFPTTLVRAALVNRKWYHLASHPRFLKKFRERYPPRLLGYFAKFKHIGKRFVPAVLPPELAGVTRLVMNSFPGKCSHIHDVRDGQFLVLRDHMTNKLAIKRPLHPDRHATIFPSIQRLSDFGYRSTQYTVLSPSSDDDDNDNDSAAIYHLHISTMDSTIFLQLLALRHNNPFPSLTSNLFAVALPPLAERLLRPPLVTHGHIYLLTEDRYIICLRLLDTECFTIQLPENSEYSSEFHHLSPGSSGSGFYYLHADGFDLRVWKRGEDGDTDCGWEAVDRIYLPEAFGCYAKHIWDSVIWDPVRRGWGEYVCIYAVGPDVEVVYLGVAGDGGVYCLDTKTRVVKKIGDNDRMDGINILPVMMTWPPTFPAM